MAEIPRTITMRLELRGEEEFTRTFRRMVKASGPSVLARRGLWRRCRDLWRKGRR